jgi:hypothetical protein
VDPGKLNKIEKQKRNKSGAWKVAGVFSIEGRFFHIFNAYLSENFLALIQFLMRKRDYESILFNNAHNFSIDM